MKETSAAYYFDLKTYAHATLFDECAHVWQALPKIGSYLSSLELGVIEGDVDPRAYLINPESITIGPGSTVEPGAYIKGPCVIGRDCTVRHGAYIRGNLVAGDRCVIGHDTEVKNAILLDGAQASHFAYVGDSILGAGCNLGAGTKCANLKLGDGEVVVRCEGEKIASGLRKFGVVIGDGAQTGCNSVTNPGTLIGPGAICYPCVSVGGFVPRESRVKGLGGRVAAS